MTTPRVTELRRTLEPTSRDTFLAAGEPAPSVAATAPPQPVAQPRG